MQQCFFFEEEIQISNKSGTTSAVSIQWLVWRQVSLPLYLSVLITNNNIAPLGAQG